MRQERMQALSQKLVTRPELELSIGLDDEIQAHPGLDVRVKFLLDRGQIVPQVSFLRGPKKVSFQFEPMSVSDYLALLIAVENIHDLAKAVSVNEQDYDEIVISLQIDKRRFECETSREHFQGMMKFLNRTPDCDGFCEDAFYPEVRKPQAC